MMKMTEKQVSMVSRLVETRGVYGSELTAGEKTVLRSLVAKGLAWRLDTETGPEYYPTDATQAEHAERNPKPIEEVIDSFDPANQEWYQDALASEDNEVIEFTETFHEIPEAPEVKDVHPGEFQGMDYDDSDIANPDDYDHARNVYAVVEECGYSSIIRAIAFADNAQDALDEAMDSGKLDCLIVPDDEITRDEDNGDTDDCGGSISYVGNYCKPIRDEGLHIIPMKKSRFAHLATPTEPDDEPAEESQADDIEESIGNMDDEQRRECLSILSKTTIAPISIQPTTIKPNKPLRKPRPSLDRVEKLIRNARKRAIHSGYSAIL